MRRRAASVADDTRTPSAVWRPGVRSAGGLVVRGISRQGVCSFSTTPSRPRRSGMRCTEAGMRNSAPHATSSDLSCPDDSRGSMGLSERICRTIYLLVSGLTSPYAGESAFASMVGVLIGGAFFAL